MPETPGNSEMDGPWPGEGEDISNDPWPGQEEIGGGDGEQMEPPEEENGSAGSDDATGGDKTAEVSSDSDLSQSAEPPAAEAEPVFSAEQEAERTRESYSEWQAAEAEKVTISRMPWLFHTVEKTYAIADVNSWLHVREGKGTNQKIVGILPKGSLCYILADADSDWVYVESGDVRGFVCARYLLRGEEAEKEVNRWQEESFPMAEMWVKPWNNKAYTYTYATTRTLLSSDEARGEVLQYAKNSWEIRTSGAGRVLQTAATVPALPSRFLLISGIPFREPHASRRKLEHAFRCRRQSLVICCFTSGRAGLFTMS